MTKLNVDDLKSVLNDQFDLIQRLGKLRLSSRFENYEEMVTIYQDILECNKVMMEIVNGPIGGIEKLVERTIGEK